MVGPLFDDYFHVLSACSIRQNLPNYRPLVYWATCAAGESLWATRLLSLSFILVAAALIVRLFFTERRRLAFLVLASHPMVLFPFFYASQISSSLTVLWAAAAAHLVMRPFRKAVLNALAAVILIPLGISVRIEAWIDAVVIIIALALFRHLLGQGAGLLRALLRVGTFVLGVLALAIIASRFSAVPILSIFDVGSSEYPRQGYFAVSIWATFLYFKNLLLPASAGFFGQWLDWFSIHQSVRAQWALYASFSSLLAAGIWGWTSRKQWVRFLSGGISVFLAVAFLFSIRYVTDWYFPGRMYLASLISIPFFLMAIYSLRVRSLTQYTLLVSLLAFNCVQLSGTYFNHYRDMDFFSSFELNASEGKTPLANFIRAKYLATIYEMPKALELHYGVYLMLTGSNAGEYSRRANVFLIQSLWNGYLLDKTIGDQENAMSAFRVLMRHDSIYSTLACLMEPSVTLKTCDTPPRRAALCDDLHKIDPDGTYNSQPIYRKSPAQFCAYGA